MHEAHIRYGYTLKDIAEYLGVHYTTVSRLLKRLRRNIKVILQRPDPIFIVRIFKSTDRNDLILEKKARTSSGQEREAMSFMVVKAKIK